MNKIIVLLIIAVSAATANPGLRCGSEVVATCPNHEACPAKPICGAKKVLTKDAKGCCCRSKYDVTQPPKPTCKANEAYGCGCRDSICNEPDVQCIRCEDGCFCAAGYVRDKVGGVCIKKDKCPAPQPSCTGENEEYGLSYCRDRRCNQPPTPCARPTEEMEQEKGCICKSGYIRDKKNKCILESDCPAPQPLCTGENEVYNCKCADDVCNKQSINCIRCQDACHCKDGYVRDVNGGKCIQKKSCPAPQPTCTGPNEIYDFSYCRDQHCGPIRDCAAPNEEMQLQKGCICKAGYVRSGTNKCILKSECPAPEPTCGVNEVYGPSYCRNQRCNQPPTPCARPTEEMERQKGCVCKSGYIRNNKNKCILESDCPAPALAV